MIMSFKGFCLWIVSKEYIINSFGIDNSYIGYKWNIKSPNEYRLSKQNKHRILWTF